jgi:hypothetical protein
MPKKKKTALTRVQKQALADLKKLQKLSKDLELGLKKVETLIGSKYGDQPTFSNCPPFRN